MQQLYLFVLKMWWYLLGVIVLILYCIHYKCYYTEDGRLYSKIPGPKQLPIIGNIMDFLLDPVPLFYRSRSLANKFKSTYGIQMFHIYGMNILEPHEIEIILSSQKHITKSFIYHFLHPWLNEGLLTSNGDKWQKRRKILTPAFHFNILRNFCKIFNEQSEKIVQSLNTEIGKPETDVISYVSQYTINSICETAMGIHLDAKGHSDFAIYKNAIREMGSLLVYRLVRIWFFANFIFNLSYFGRRQNKILPALHNFTLDVIRQRRKTVLTKDTSTIISEIENDEYMKSNKRRLAMLDLLLSAESDGKINEQGIREEVDTFMFEGHDTTTMGISFCLMLLANHPAVQERVVAELDEIFGDSNQSATMEDLNKMRYLEMCLKESLRLYPSVPFISRVVTEKVQMTNYLIPAGTLCHIYIFDLHRSANLYPAPDEFIPERFTLENCAKRHPFAYIPFSAGPRNCIGQKFALYEEKSIISSILRNFQLLPVTKPQDIIFSADMVLRSRDPIKVKILPRKRNAI